MDNQNINNQISVIQNSLEVFKSAPEILKQNQERTAKAKAVGEDILKEWSAAWAIDDEEERMKALAEIDARSNNFLANAAQALKEEKELRAAITQMMDVFKKMFTEAESELDKTKDGTVTQRVQANRDNRASEVNNVNERKRLEAEMRAQKEKEAAEIKAEIEVRLSAYFNDFMLSQKQRLQAGFNKLELKTFADDAAAIRLYKPEYKRSLFDLFDPKVFSSTHTPEELQALRSEVMNGKYEGYAETYVLEMTELKREIVDKLPSKFEELKEQKRLADEAAAAAEEARQKEAERQSAIANANAEEKKRLEAEAEEARKKEAERQAELKAQQEAGAAEQKRREQEEADRLAREAEQAKAKAAQDAELKKQEEQTMLLFNKEAELAEAAQETEARADFEITVKHPTGYMLIVQYWFANEGKNLPVEKIGNTKPEQMKAWCEKQAKKTGEKIDSPLLSYAETFKAINRKTK